MTSTNHEPFDAKVDKIFNSNESSDNYKNTVHYTDKCISDYLRKAKAQAWYSNTLFIITSDHAHSMPLQRGYNEPERHRIPLLFFGDVVKQEFKGKTINKFGTQTDFPAMLLSQLNIDHNNFLRSLNLFNYFSPEFAFYTFDNGFGIITPQQTLVYDHNSGKVTFSKNKMQVKDDSLLLNKGKALLQVVFEEYIGFNN